MARASSAGWQDLAACRTCDPELFFPISSKGQARVDIARARAVCRACEVRQTCLEYALANGQQHGIWGGLTEEERLRLISRAAVAPA